MWNHKLKYGFGFHCKKKSYFICKDSGHIDKIFYNKKDDVVTEPNMLQLRTTEYFLDINFISLCSFTVLVSRLCCLVLHLSYFRVTQAHRALH